MNDTFNLPYLGTVMVEDRLIEYDGLRLFTILASNGGRLLGFWAIDRLDESIFWYAPITKERYRNLLRGKVELRRIFEEPEGDFVLEVSWNEDASGYIDATYKRAGDLNADALPEPHYYLTSNSEESAVCDEFIESANTLAKRSGRPIGRLIFDFGVGIHEGPARPLATSILHTQRVLDAIAHSEMENPKEFGAIPVEILNQAKFGLRPLFPGSLGIELIAEQEVNLWQESVAGKSLDILLDVLEMRSNSENLKEKFTHLTGRTAKAYRDLLDSFVKVGANVSVEIGLPRLSGERRVNLSKKDIMEAMDAMQVIEKSKGVEREFDANLIAYDRDTPYFRAIRLSDDKKFKGRVSKRLLDEVSTVNVEGKYHVHIWETIEYDSITGDSKVRYELTHLSEINP